MTPDEVVRYLFGAVFVFVIGAFVYKAVKNGGLRGAMFGAPIIATVGEVSASKGALVRMVVKIHKLGADTGDKTVGLELVTKSVASYQMMPISLSKAEARKLASFLESAAQ